MEEKPKFIMYEGCRYSLRAGYYIYTERLHRRIWKNHFGEIPHNYHIHHKNGDTTDNRIENLECISKKDHHRMHFDKEKQLKILHSPENKKKAQKGRNTNASRKKQSEKSKKQWENRKPIEKVCVICSIKFLTKNFTGTKYCGQRCRSMSQYRRDQILVDCVICQKKFYTFKKKNHSITCSPSCSAKYAGMKRRGVWHDFVSTVNR